MRIAIVSAVFPPEPLTSAFAAADLCFELEKRGHTIVVITTFPNRPLGVIEPGYVRSFMDVKKTNSSTVIRSWHTLSRSSTMISRFMENVSFGITSSIVMLKDNRFDVVYLLTWPIFAQGLNALVILSKSTPIVCGIGDIYPETLSGKGMIIRGRLTDRILLSIDKMLLNHCARVITVSDGMNRYLVKSRELQEDKVITIPNWLDITPYDLLNIDPTEAKARLKIHTDKFTAMFAGSLTMSAGLELYLKAAEALRHNNMIEIVIVGDGSEREWLAREIKRRSLHNIKLIYPLHPTDVPTVQAAADVLMFSITGESRNIAAPSKQISYMFSSKPIIACIDSHSTPAAIVMEAKDGVVVDPDRPDLLADTIYKMSCMPSEELIAMGARGNHYARDRYDKNKLLMRMADLLEANAVKL